MAPMAKKVVGVEIVEEAVEAARRNAELNGLHNCEFIAGDVLKVIDAIEEKPDIIILDEPTVGLDPKQIIEIRELIRELAKEHTVILSSHILAEVREVCDYIMIISRGKLVASDTPENLEHLMAGQNSLEIETKAEPERVRKILRSISGIDKIELERTEEATTYARIETGTAASGEDQDIREAIFLAFAEAGCPLLMLKASKASLEEVFMELTQGEEATADAGDL